MANIVISGDSSGSVTLSAPAVSGTTVLTLPTTSGTILTTAGGAAGSFTTLTSSGASSFATSSGNVGIGTGSPQRILTVGSGSGSTVMSIFGGTGSSSAIHFTDTNTTTDFQGFVTYGHDVDALRFGTAETERMRIDSAGDVLIGTTSQPTNNAGELTVQAGSSIKPAIQWSGGDTNWWGRLSTSTAGGSIGTFNSIGGMWSINGSTFTCKRDLAGFPSAAFYVSNQLGSTFNPYFQWLYNTGGSGLTDGTTTIPMTLDPNGYLGIGKVPGTSILDIAGDGQSGANNMYLTWSTTSTGYAPALNLRKSNGSKASPTAVVNNDELGVVVFAGYDGSNYQNGAYIQARVDGTPGTNDMPGRIGFFTTPDGSPSANERMRISSAGFVMIGKSDTNSATQGAYFNPASGGFFHFVVTNESSTSTQSTFYLNRQTSDGRLIEFRQADTAEGDISVSGTTVSYNGGHLSRWSQLPDGSKDDTLLKGTILSNLDDMCVWVKDGKTLPNEQLNKMQVSSVEGDTNVAGVFVNWTRDEDCNTDDMNVAMTGDMIIRIADGVVVQKGNLLMSAGDGTAKPQGDDIVRSKTVAKVTSNYVTCTYADGSYCVPCVLMAC